MKRKQAWFSRRKNKMVVRELRGGDVMTDDRIGRRVMLINRVAATEIQRQPTTRTPQHLDYYNAVG